MLFVQSVSLNYSGLCVLDMRNSFVVSVMFGVCSVFAPLLFRLWIYSGSANANFYFAITLVYTSAHVSRHYTSEIMYGICYINCFFAMHVIKYT